MPPNRRTTPKDQRESPILDAAEASFAGRGWDGTSIASISREVGLAANAVVWYFPTKDALLSAVVARIAAREGLDEGLPLRELLRRLVRYRPYQAIVHARARQSPEVAAAHERVHAAILRAAQAEVDDPLDARVLVACVQGALEDPGAEVDAIVARAIERLRSR